MGRGGKVVCRRDGRPEGQSFNHRIKEATLQNKGTVHSVGYTE